MAGDKEQGHLDTPLEPAIRNQVDRFRLAIEANDRVPSLRAAGGHARGWLLGRQIECRAYSCKDGIDILGVVRRAWKGRRGT